MSSATSEPSGVVGRDDMAFAPPKAAKKRRGAALKPAPPRDPASDSGAFQPRPSPEAEVQPPVPVTPPPPPPPPPIISPEPRGLAVGAPLASIPRRTASADSSDAAASTPVPLPTVFAQPKRTATASEPPVEIIKPSSARAAEPTMEPVLASTTTPKTRRTAAINATAGGSAKPSEPEPVDEADDVPEPRVSKVRRTAAIVVPKGLTPGLDGSETRKPGEEITPNPMPEPTNTINEPGVEIAPQEPAAAEDETPELPLPRISKTRRTAAIVVPKGPTPGLDDSETRKPGEDITADPLPEPTDTFTESGGKIAPHEPAAAEDETSEAPLSMISKTRRAAAIVVPKGPALGEDPESTAKPEDTTAGLVTRGRKPTSDLDPGATGLSTQPSTASPPPPTFDRAATSKTYAIDNTTKSRLSPPAFDRAATSKTYAVDNTTRAAILNKSREERSKLVPLPEAAKPTTSAGGPGLVSRGRSRVSEPDTGAARLPLKTRSHSPPPPTPPKFDRAATSGTHAVDNTSTTMLADLGDPTKKPSRTVSRGMSPAPAKGRRGLRKKKGEDDADGLGRTSSHSPTRRNDKHSQVSGDASGNDSKLPPPTLESSADVAQSPAGLDLDRNVSGDYGDVFATKASTFHQNVSEAFSDLSLGDSTHQHFAGEGGQQRRGSNEMDGSGPGRSKARQPAMRRTNSFGDAKGKAENQSAMDGSNDSAAYAKKNSAMDGSNYSAAYSRVSTPSKPGAFSAAGRGLRKNKVNDDVSVANSKTSDAAPQVGAFAATGRGLRKKRTAEEGGSDRSLETGTGTADASSVPAATGLRAARQQHRMNAENAKARKGGRSLSPVPGLMRHHSDSKDGPPRTITLGSSSPKPRNSLASSVASSVLATELLKEMVEEGHIPTAMPDLDSVTKSVGSGTNGKKAGTLQFFGQSGAAASTANINEISNALAEEAEADMLLKIASKTRGEERESVNKTGGKAPGQVIHVTQQPVDNTQAVERQESAGIRYSNQGVPDKRTIPPGYDGPGAYSGRQGNQYDRNSSIHFENLTLSAHTGDGAAPRESTRSSRSSSKSLFDADVEQARRRESELGDIKEESSSRKTLYLGIGVLLVVIIVIAVVVAVVAGGGGGDNGGGGEAAKEATPIPEADPTEAPAQPVDFDESVIPTLSDTSIGVSTIATIVDDPTSPQALAFAWVAEDPNLQDYSDWRRLQRFALATFYHSFNGPKWKASDDQAKNWMSYEVDECDWFPYETACTEAGRVRYIRFNRLSQFRGSVPPELVLLEQLDEMDLSNNILNSVDVLLTSSMPASLRILRCSLCRLSGPIPSQIGLVSSLQALVLSENSITGSLPSEMALLTRMDSLLLNDNAIGGRLPSALGGMHSMINLALDSNSFTGAIPVELLTSMPILEYLGIGFNSLSNSIPSEIGLLTSLVRADLESNSLTGSLPSQVGLMAKMTSLDLLGNGLVGRVPTELGQLGALRALGLASNSLSVTIPTELGTATSLVSIDMAVNKLTGTVPSELGQLVHLEQLTLFGNSLTGNIPSEVAALPKLTLLKVFGS